MATYNENSTTFSQWVIYTDGDGKEYTALVVKRWSAAVVNLLVFQDGTNDDKDGNLVTWKTSVQLHQPDSNELRDPMKVRNTWRFQRGL